MNKFRIGILFAFGLCTLESNGQNLLNLNEWVTGTGNIAGFSPSGLATENLREWGIGPQGTQVVLWKATPSGDQDADGGFNSADIPINNQKTYRYVVWIKKTNSKDGAPF